MTLRLSDAIRLGATLKPQGFGVDSFGIRSCAITAACDALGISMDSRRPQAALDEFWPLYRGLADIRVECPACGLSCYHLAIVHLNDVHKWSRERIADWVEQIEQSQEVKLEEQTVNA